MFPKGDPDWATQADRWLQESLSDGEDRALLIEHPCERRLAPPELISSVAEGALAVIVGAWDDEGWIVWEPDRRSSAG